MLTARSKRSNQEDSCGAERLNAGRCLQGLEQQCARSSFCVGFTTTGALKYEIPPRSLFSSGKESLYLAGDSPALFFVLSRGDGFARCGSCVSRETFGGVNCVWMSVRD